MYNVVQKWKGQLTLINNKNNPSVVTREKEHVGTDTDIAKLGRYEDRSCRGLC